jgi:hypothetical protein
MNGREYKKHCLALRNHALLMSVEGLQESIREDWNNPKWPSILFDAMNDALEKKMGKHAYSQWFNSLAEKVEGEV